MRAARAFVTVLLVALAGGCRPDVGSPLSLVAGPRLLAVRGTPAEAKPGVAVTYDALAVDTSGVIASPQLGWSLCHVPKPPAEANAVSSACLSVPDDAGPAATYMAPMPVDPYDACKFFGPVPRQAGPNEPAIRPRDPDITGGFYQPLRVTLTDDPGSEIGFYLERIHCNLANAPRDAVNTFNETYTDNVNPTIARLTLDPDGQPANVFEMGAAAPAAPGAVPAGATVTLEAAWTDATPESYPVWNASARALETRREALRLSWFATAGEIDLETTGRGEDEPELTTRNTWRAPTAAGVVHFWAVLRDSRGGVDFAAFDLEVTP